MSSQYATESTAPSDGELIAAVRGGDGHAYGELFERHREAALRLARQLAGPSDADDLVSDAFVKVLRVLNTGGGPDLAFRAYLLTSVRHLHVDRIRRNSRVTPTDELENFDPGIPFADPAVAEFENAAASKAFASLPERWQLVLWHVEVEGQKPAEVALLLGMSANGVSALAYRAREGLRQAYLQMHMADTAAEECRWVTERLGARVRNGLSRRDTTKVDEHLDECPRCAAVYLELSEVNSNLAGLLAPLLLGTAAAGYLSSAGSSSVGVAALLFNVRHFLKAHGGLTAASTAAGVVAVGVAAAVIVNGGSPKQDTAADGPGLAAPASQSTSTSAPPSDATDPTSTARDPNTSPSNTRPDPSAVVPPAIAPTDLTTPSIPIITTSVPTTDPTSEPTSTETRTTPPVEVDPPVVELDIPVTEGPAPLTVTVDASGSSAPGGGQLTYAFDFGDPPGGGALSPPPLLMAPTFSASQVGTSESTASHTYRTPGSYTLRVSVTNEAGDTTTKSREITVDSPVVKAPIADVTVTPNQGDGPLEVGADASGSSDPQDQDLTYTFDWGDGTDPTIGAKPAASHTYFTRPNEMESSYTLTLMATNTSGLSSSVKQDITVTAPAPKAVLSVKPGEGPGPLPVTADASGSTDPQEQDLTYTFDWGDGDATTGAEPTASHTYVTRPKESRSSYTLALIVTNTSGLSTTVKQEITVTAQEPVAILDVTRRFGWWSLWARADMSGSFDPQGEGLTCSLNWGDGTAESQVDCESRALHHYSRGGTYTVTLTVTNTSQQVDTATDTVTVWGGCPPWLCGGNQQTPNGVPAAGSAPAPGIAATFRADHRLI